MRTIPLPPPVVPYKAKKRKIPDTRWSSLSKQRSFLDGIATKMNINSFEGWYNVTSNDVVKNGGGGLISKHYGNSISKMLKTVYPEYNWNFVLFKQVPSGYWDTLSNQRTFLDQLANQLKIESLDGWYSVTGKDVIQCGGGGLLRRYEGSLSKLLGAIYPEYPWDVQKFTKVPRDYWNDLSNQRSFLDGLATKLNFNTPDDWYKVSAKAINEHGGRGLFKHYDFSIPKMLTSVYSEHHWDEQKFVSVPASIENTKRRVAADELAAKLHVKTMEDWYNVTTKQIRSHGGRPLLEQYGNSISKMLTSVYPEYSWDIHRFHAVPTGHWQNIANQRAFLDEVAKKMQITSFEEWYNVNGSDIRRLGGSGLLINHYHNSVIKMLKAVYPEYPWNVHNFKQVPHKHWSSLENQRSFMTKLDELVRATGTTYSAITRDFVAKHGGKTLLDRYGSISNLIKSFIPNANLERPKGSTLAKLSKSQQYLTDVVRSLFGNVALLADYRHQDLLFKGTYNRMELDVFFPTLSIAFEYQGEQHYHNNFLSGSPEALQQRDAEKKAACLEQGITLVTVPYWWNKDKDSIVSLICHYRPDLMHAPNNNDGILWKHIKRKSLYPLLT